MRPILRPLRNFILPAMMLFPLGMLMVGCLYIPTFEQVSALPAKQDFRRFVTGKSAELAVGRTIRKKVLGLLGKPSAQSSNGQAVVYFVVTSAGYWVIPQCFNSFHAFRKVHVLSLVFDETGALKKQEVFVVEGGVDGPPIIQLGSIVEPAMLFDAEADAIRRINHENGVWSQYCPPPPNQIPPLYIDPGDGVLGSWGREPMTMPATQPHLEGQ